MQTDKADQEKIYKQLEVELKKKKGSVSAVREMIVLTFKQQRSETHKIEDANPIKVVLQKFPFLTWKIIFSKLQVRSADSLHHFPLDIWKPGGSFHMRKRQGVPFGKFEFNSYRRLMWTLSELHYTPKRYHLKRNRFNY